MTICNYCGKENEDTATQCWVCGKELSLAASAGVFPETPPELPGPRLINPKSLEAAFHYEDGFHHADWEFIRRWIESNVEPLDVSDAWSEAALLWVTKIRDDLGGGYYVLQSSKAVVLCDNSMEMARWLLDYTARTADTIKERLGEVAWSGTFGKDVVIVFSEQDDYYQYLSHHSPDGEQASSGGACVHSGYTHIIIPWHDQATAANTIVHELSHDCMAHLPLPLWLNEGVAVTLERAIASPPSARGQGEQTAILSAAINWHAPMMWDELAERHFAFWTEANVQSFWAGTSFYEPGDSNELSYSLAEVLVKLLSERGNAALFQSLLRAAHADDAGQTAAMDILGVDLGEIAGTFLGEGNWRPQRKAIIERWELAGWRKSGDDCGDTTEDSPKSTNRNCRHDKPGGLFNAPAAAV
jgi:hypothetical protein